MKHDLRASLGSLLTVCELARFGSAERLMEVQNGRPDPGPVREGGPLLSRIEDLPTDAPTPMTVRELSDLANVDRRTAPTVAAIDERLQTIGLKAVPSITDAEIDEQIVITPLDDRVQRERPVVPLSVV